MKKLVKGTLLLLGLGVFILTVVVGYLVTASLPDGKDKIVLNHLDDVAKVSLDLFGVPLISAQSRQDAFMILGYLTARDRLFQMDLLRRKAAGRLAEIFGKPALQLDTNQRILGFEDVAKKVITLLPAKQRNILDAYAKGVNNYVSEQKVLPVEFLVLHYQPERWRLEDSVLVALTMFQTLSGGNQDERMLSVMNHEMSPKVVAFFTPDTDSFDTILLGGKRSHRSSQPIPVKPLASLLKRKTLMQNNAVVAPEHFLERIVVNDVVPGSNQWAVSSLKTQDNRAILANDMHLPLGVPNIWYRASLQYSNARLDGLTLPGVPLLLAGTNNHIAWGYTNLMADVRDLIALNIDPKNQNQYQTPTGWQPFKHRVETIKIKDSVDVHLELKQTIWGPVMPEPLLGQPVSLKWSALDPTTINFKVLEMDDTHSLDEAIALFNEAGMPPSNIMLADDKGQIGWTLTGSIPARRGFDGSVSVPWVNPDIGWQGYIKPSELPRVINPPAGFLATANNRTLGTEYPYIVGHNYGNSYRAFRISQRLAEMDSINEAGLHQLQQDTLSDFYQFYHQLALSIVTEKKLQNSLDWADLRQALEKWDGKASVNSLGFGLLVEFRKQLARFILPDFFKVCSEVDQKFTYSWYKMDTPLRALLSQKIPETQPSADKFSGWDELILAALKKSADTMRQTYHAHELQSIKWGSINKTNIGHPFSKAFPALSSLLDMPTRQMSGCSFCINVVSNEFGVSQRLVVSPGHLEDGILVMPTGQSGHPLSPNYKDQHPYWQQGLPLKLISDTFVNKITFFPINTP